MQRSGLDKLSTAPDSGYQKESDTLTVIHHKRGQAVSPFPAGDYKTRINRRAQRHNKHKTEKTHKHVATKEVPPWNGQ